jgi:hypothetical protein
MRKRTLALTAALLLALTSFSAHASGRDDDDDDDYWGHHGGHHHGPKFDWVFFPAPQPGLKCKKVVIFIPKWDDHWLASYHPGRDDDDDDDDDDDRRRHHKKFKKVIGFLCKVPVSRY